MSNQEENIEDIIPLTQPIERGIRRRIEEINTELFGERLLIIEYEVNEEHDPVTPVDQMIQIPDQPPRVVRRRLE
jgi:hypothetical protein